MNKLCIYFFWDKDGIVDDYVPYALEKLKEIYATILVVVNGTVNAEGHEKLARHAKEVLYRENEELDVGAYRHGFRHVGYEKLSEYDEVLVTNFTLFGPMYPLSEMYGVMDAKDCDFWGLTLHPIEKSPSQVQIHVQSYYVVYKKRLLESPCFKDYWESRPEIKGYEDSVRHHELAQTPYFLRNGFTFAGYVPVEKYYSYSNYNSVITCADRQLIEDRNPFLKRRIFYRSEMIYGTMSTTKLKYLTNYIKAYCDYDYTLLSDNVKRSVVSDYYKHDKGPSFKQLLFRPVMRVKLFFHYLSAIVFPFSSFASKSRHCIEVYTKYLSVKSLSEIDKHLCCLNLEILASEHKVDANVKKPMDIGKNSYLSGASFFGNANTVMGKFCSIGQNCVFGHGEHPANYLSSSPYFYYDSMGYKRSDRTSHNEFWICRHIVVGHDVWIGDGAFVKNGITIGNGAIIGARSVVTKDVPPYAIVVGSPAKILRYRFDEQTIADLQRLRWWDLDGDLVKQLPYDDMPATIQMLKAIRGEV